MSFLPQGPHRCGRCGTDVSANVSLCPQGGARIGEASSDWQPGARTAATAVGCIALVFGALGACFLSFSESVSGTP